MIEVLDAMDVFQLGIVNMKCKNRYVPWIMTKIKLYYF